MEQSPFELVEPTEVVIAGLPSVGMTIRSATGRRLGRLRGFVVERAHQRVRYLVVRTSGIWKKTTLVPFSTPRLDVKRRAIEIEVDDRELWQLRNFTPEQLLTA